MTNLKDTILDISRQNQTGALTPWFENQLGEFIDFDVFADEKQLTDTGNLIIKDLIDYREQAGISTAVIGMSGGVDSALTAALFKKAGWRVIGVTLPIHQNPEETKRGVEACYALGIEHEQVDLSDMFVSMQGALSDLDEEIDYTNDSMVDKATRIRRGNIRARLRMITLYNLAAKYGGVVASTDNYSELAMSFFTINGDVGDVAPIQSLLKSWEVPMLAKLFGVPEKTWRAKPTDGLGVANGDEDQFGFTYLELDLMLLAIGDASSDGETDDIMVNMGGVNLENLFKVMDELDGDLHAKEVFDKMLDRMGSSWFKRYGTVNLNHPFDNTRYRRLDQINSDFFLPKMLK